MNMWTIKNALAMSVGVACAAAGGVAYGSALDRSGQSLLGFLERGNYFEFGGSLLDASVKGVDMSGNPTGNVANAYNFVGATIKFQPFDKVSVGFIYDEPFGAAAEYEGENDFVTSPTDAVFAGLPVVTGPSIVSDGQLAAYGLDAGISGGTKVEVETSTLSAIVGYQPTENWNIYGGAVYQKVEGSVRLRGSTYSMFNGYDMSLPSTHEWGWLAGVAYEIPDIALKISLTYRSEIDYDANMRESLPLVAAVGANSAELGGLIQQLVLNGSIPAETGQAIGAALGNLAGGLCRWHHEGGHATVGEPRFSDWHHGRHAPVRQRPLGAVVEIFDPAGDVRSTGEGGRPGDRQAGRLQSRRLFQGSVVRRPWLGTQVQSGHCRFGVGRLGWWCRQSRFLAWPGRGVLECRAGRSLQPDPEGRTVRWREVLLVWRRGGPNRCAQLRGRVQGQQRRGRGREAGGTFLGGIFVAAIGDLCTLLCSLGETGAVQART